MNNRWRKIVYLKYGMKLNKNYKYAESIIDTEKVESVKRTYSFKLYKTSSFRKGTRHYATKQKR